VIDGFISCLAIPAVEQVARLQCRPTTMFFSSTRVRVMTAPDAETRTGLMGGAPAGGLPKPAQG
jgi:hypothetical protein